MKSENFWEDADPSAINWHQIIFQYFDKPERFKALWHIRDHIDKAYIAELFTNIWVQSESHYQDQEVIGQLLKLVAHDIPAFQRKVMSKEERDTFNALFANTNHIEVYRGCWQENRQGYSWTTNKDVAIKFANRHVPDGDPLLLTGRVHKDSVIAYLEDRDEFEIIVEPSKVSSVILDHLTPKKSTYGASLFQLVQSGNFFSEEQSLAKDAMMISINPDMGLQFLQDRLGFYRRFDFSKQVKYWEKVQKQVSKERKDEQLPA